MADLSTSSSNGGIDPNETSQQDIIIKQNRFNDLKEKVKRECARRCYPRSGFPTDVGSTDYGKPVDVFVDGDWEYQFTPTNNEKILYEHYNKLSVPIRKINNGVIKGNGTDINPDPIKAGSKEQIIVPGGPQGRIINDVDLTVLEAKVRALSVRNLTNNSTSDCSVACTGTCTHGCSGSCQNGCSTGCGGTCGGNCGSNCTGACETSCGNSCGGSVCGSSCTAYCGNGCVGHCVQSCFYAGSKARQNEIYKMWGSEKTTSVCADDCVSECRRGCGNKCGSPASCGNNCNTYWTSIAGDNGSTQATFYGRALTPYGDTNCLDSRNYYYLQIKLVTASGGETYYVSLKDGKRRSVHNLSGWDDRHILVG